MIPLSELVDRYRLAKGVSSRHATLQARSVALFTAFVGHPATVADLVPESVSRWIAWLETLHYSQWTIAGHRSRLLALWRWFDASADLRMVRPARPPEPLPEAWTAEELSRLLAAADRMREGAAWFRAIILAAYETGLRRSDLCGLSRHQIAADGTLQLRQRKTGSPVVVRMRASTAALVLALPGEQPLAIPWGSRRYTDLWRELCRLANVPLGGLQKLRRTGASYIARDFGMDAAREWLGHRTEGMVRHYVDRRIATITIRQPPRVA